MNISFDKKIILFLLICLLIYFQGILRLPVMDRDEARFATASKTMLIEKEYIDIKMVDEKRYKKPIGIYWSQILSNLAFGSYPYDKIWVYRLPSLIGIFAGLLLAFFMLRNFDNKNTAFLTVFFLVCSILTISEAHQSKTDGLLFFFVSLCNLIIYKMIQSKNLSYLEKLTFWISFALGILIKGPIIFIFIIFPLISFSIIKKKNFLKDFWIPSGFMIFILISVPWFIAINIKSGGLFWAESIGNDLLNKVKSGQESHGFPPGYYTLLLFLFFWPGSIFVISLINNLKSNLKKIKQSDNLTYYLIISFLLPFLFFEIIPTKLPHYIYPSYLPLSFLISRNIIKLKFKEESIKFALIPLIIFPISIVTLIIASIIQFSNYDIVLIFMVITLLIFIVFLIFLEIKKKIKNLIMATGFFQLSVYFLLIFFLIPRLEVLWVSNKINNIISEHENYVERVFTIGFNEPSLLFLTSHKSSNSLKNLRKDQIFNEKILLIITEKSNKNLRENRNYSSFKLIGEFNGFNYSRGENIKFKVYKN